VWEQSGEGEEEVNMIATSSGVRSLREYLQLHSTIGEPAVRKISRQVIKGAFCSQKCCPYVHIHWLIGRLRCHRHNEPLVPMGMLAAVAHHVHCTAASELARAVIGCAISSECEFARCVQQ
jgi:hypothetical protein